MAGRGRTSYQKRQKEQARLEKRQRKAEKRDARKAAAKSGTQDNFDEAPQETSDASEYESQQPSAD